MRFFLAGIMQGSLPTAALHEQSYREYLRSLIETHFPGANVYDPWAAHQDSLAYDDATARSVFYDHNRLCREVDVVIAFVPEASMGTAIEMWEAHEHGHAVVVTISPMDHNWAIRYCSHFLYHDLPAFQAALQRDGLADRIRALVSKRRQVRVG